MKFLWPCSKTTLNCQRVFVIMIYCMLISKQVCLYTVTTSVLMDYMYIYIYVYIYLVLYVEEKPPFLGMASVKIMGILVDVLPSIAIRTMGLQRSFVLCAMVAEVNQSLKPEPS